MNTLIKSLSLAHALGVNWTSKVKVNVIVTVHGGWMVVIVTRGRSMTLILVGRAPLVTDGDKAPKPKCPAVLMYAQDSQ